VNILSAISQRGDADAKAHASGDLVMFQPATAPRKRSERNRAFHVARRHLEGSPG
jgi:hypothetical protein